MSIVKNRVIKKEKRGSLMEVNNEANCELNILDFFPYFKYPIREAQKNILEDINKVICKGKKYIIIQAPTGVGKSAITYTLLDFFKDGMGYVCTSVSSTIISRNNYIV